MNKTLIRVVVILVVGGIAAAATLVYKGGQRSAREAEYLAELLADLSRIQTDDAGRAYIEGLARAVHPEAIRGAFTPSGLTGGTYNVNVYQRAAIDRMIERARSDGSRHIAEELEEFKSKATLELTDSPGG